MVFCEILKGEEDERSSFLCGHNLRFGRQEGTIAFFSSRGSAAAVIGGGGGCRGQRPGGAVGPRLLLLQLLARLPAHAQLLQLAADGLHLGPGDVQLVLQQLALTRVNAL